MRIVALMAWYREDAAWLAGCIRSLTKLPITHLIAVDGSYSRFPDPQPRSSLQEYEAIVSTCHEHRIGLTIHAPTQPWAGNECEKRSKLFELADQEPADFYFVMDADQQVTTVPADLHERLEQTDRDVARVTFLEPHPDPKRNKRFTVPVLFRAIPGIQVQGNHFTYRTPDGRALWGNALRDDLAPYEDLTDLEIEHLTNYRAADRQQQARSYYTVRDEEKVEDFECSHPDCTRTAKHTIPAEWFPAGDHVGITAEWVYACPTHHQHYLTTGRRLLAQHVGSKAAQDYYRRRRWFAPSDHMRVELHENERASA